MGVVKTWTPSSGRRHEGSRGRLQILRMGAKRFSTNREDSILGGARRARTAHASRTRGAEGGRAQGPRQSFRGGDFKEGKKSMVIVIYYEGYRGPENHSEPGKGGSH